MNPVEPTAAAIRSRSLAMLKAAMLGVLAVSLTFVWFTGIVLKQELVRFDERVSLFFRDPANQALSLGPPWVAEAIRDMTSLGSITVTAVIVFLAVVFLVLLKRRGDAIFVAVTSAGSLTLNTAIKLAIERPRPTAIDVSPLVFTSSFPSGHAALSAATCLSLAGVASRWVNPSSARLIVFGAAILLTLLVGSSRIYLGLHRPTDVMAGWMIGIAWFLVSWVLAEALSIR